MKKQAVALCLFLIIYVCMFGCQLTEKPIKAPIENGEQISNNTELPSEQNIQTEVDAVSEQTNVVEAENETVQEIIEEPVTVAEVEPEPDIEITNTYTEKTESESVQTITEQNKTENEVESKSETIEENDEPEMTIQTIECSGITLSQTSLSLTEGETVKITATVTPDNATDKSVKWSISDKNIATVDNGTVTAVSSGNAKITAETSNGKKAEVAVEVKAKVVAPMGDSAPFYYYSLLNSSEKAFYDALLDGALNGQTVVSDLEKYNFSVSDFNKLIDYFRLDQISLFNLSSSTGYQYNSDNIIVSVSLSYIMDDAEFSSATAELNSVAADIKKQAQQLATERERALLVYDYVKDCFYYYGTSERAYNMYYAYKDGYGVCEAYSKLFGFLLSSIGIESIQVNGFGHNEYHRWVMAKIDGKWYHFDPTWDDPIGQSEGFVYYNYFAVDDSQIKRDHSIDNPELLPKADSNDANFFVSNGILLEGTSNTEFESVALKSYALTGQIVFSCTDSVYSYILSNQDCLWTFVHAVSPSSTGLSFVNYDFSNVIEIIFN